MRIRIPLTANIPARQPFKAQSVVIASTGAASSVDFKLAGTDWQDVEPFGQCERMFGVYDPARTFTGVELVSTVDCVVELLVSRSRVDVMDGANVTATIAAAQLPLPVDLTRGGAPGTPVYVSGAVLGDTPAGTVTDLAGVEASAAGAALLAADATRLEVIFFNQGPDPVAIGRPGLTWAKRCIVLSAGDTHIEARAAAKDWVAVVNAGTAATVTMQERKA